MCQCELVGQIGAHELRPPADQVGESELRQMNDEKYKCDVAGDALQGIASVVEIGIGCRVVVGAHGDFDAVQRVKRQRQEDAEDLEHRQPGQFVKGMHRLVESLRPGVGHGVGQQMLDQEGADGDNSR